MTNDEEILHVEHVIERLVVRYPDLPRETVEKIVHSAHAHYANGKVRDFVPLLVERNAREMIQGLALS
ncbi:three-helix bundle dimerization domain-containing protein [Rhodococcus wratislaviensis]|uniref:Uncharacterized protein n=1 Tax=Rhodococcus wratislaviensis NBRC 100605 TaxID=1219028 RepID=X0PLQ7_RHOWR|nr:hypothetical protein [Rhodococcus wratislaviensis]GAF43328.1 hypothetical protein RW1_006_02270 [Rhodococcus wratislaviensis NBRC 100605]